MNRRYFLSSSIALGAFAALAKLPFAAALCQNPFGSNEAQGDNLKSKGSGAQSSPRSDPLPAVEEANLKSKGIRKVNKTDAEWKQILTPEQYNVIRQKGTEDPYTSQLNENHDTGTFESAASELPLFSS